MTAPESSAAGRRWSYAFGGLHIKAARPVPGLRPLADRSRPVDRLEVDLRLSGAPAPVPDVVHSEGPRRYGLTLGASSDGFVIGSTFGTFVVGRHGRAITLHSPDGEPTAGAVDTLVRRVLPCVAVLGGDVTLHAAAVGRDHRATLLLGASGAGKSTLAAALARSHGWDVLSEDCTVVRVGEEPVVLAAAPGIALWPGSVDLLGLPAEACTPMPGFDERVWFRPPATPDTSPRTLGACAFLRREPGHQLTITELGRPDGMMRLVSQYLRLNLAPDGEREPARVMAQVEALRRRVRCVELHYGERTPLAEVSAVLEGLL